MIINEIDQHIPGMQDLDSDETTKYALRRTRLTLMQLNKLRKMNDIRTYEKEAKLVNIRAQYGSPPEGTDEPF